MQTFFSNFKTIQYNGATAVDITQSVAITPDALVNPFTFNTYTVSESIRSDQAARKLYGDANLEWLLFLSNQETDPYQWYMDSDQFQDFVNQKYGDWILAQNKIKYYINNWYSDQNTLTVSGYNALPPNLTKYYYPVYDADLNPIEYIRTQANWKVNTNHLVQLNFTINVASFTLDEIINVQWDNNVTGNGQVAFTSNNALYFQHVTGNYLPVNNFINVSSFSIVGQESNSTITISNTNQITVSYTDTLDPTEDVYYSPISYYDHENIINEQNKEIVLLSNNYVSTIVNDIKSIF